MRFLDLIKEHNGIRFPADCLGELSSFFISYISGRCSDQTGHGIFLHVLAHIDTNHVILIIKQRCRQSFGKLCLADAGRS